jgi:signal transduction histidine kinase
MVESADAARRELADDLRNGPLRRLDRVADLLRVAATGPDFDPGSPGSASEALGDLIGGLDRATAVLRDLVLGIAPPALAAGGLVAGLHELARLTPVEVSLSVPADRFPGVVESTAYFVCAEALANVARHANTSCAWITAQAQDGWLRIEIEDDGDGGAKSGGDGKGGGSGLRGLADRVAAVGGTISVYSPPGMGTRLVVELPLPETEVSGSDDSAQPSAPAGGGHFL